jgi:hypothetical protein
VRPSDGVISILLIVDRYFRTYSKPSYLQCYVYILKGVGSADVLELREHITDTAIGIANHSTSLIKNVIKVMYDLRQHHYAKTLKKCKVFLHATGIAKLYCSKGNNMSHLR